MLDSDTHISIAYPFKKDGGMPHCTINPVNISLNLESYQFGPICYFLSAETTNISLITSTFMKEWPRLEGKNSTYGKY